ncbi:MAG: methyltransferase domain-containing protein [Candidatus Omnitrophota bacterium]|nr:methyltransferase domain-containing protein [Candidatus Omnitrophota bacterium]
MFLNQFHPKDFKRTIEVYRQYEELKMEDGWDPPDKADAYRRMAKIAPVAGFLLKGATCLDVGCGTGDFSAYVRKRGARSYTGIDILGSVIATARKKYPKEKFLKQDILKQAIEDRYDFVFCSGALSVKLSVDNYVFLASMVKAMLGASKKGLVFNFLTDIDEDPDEDLFFYNVGRVVGICLRVAPKSQITVLRNRDEARAHVYMVL